MSNDGWNTDYPVNPDEPTQDTQPQRAVNFMQDAMGNQSRRKFLRAAVMSGAAVAAVGATAGVAALASNNSPSVFATEGATPTPSGPPSCALKIEGSALDGNCFNQFDYDPNAGPTGSTNPGTFFLFFTAHNVAPGSYTITITRDPGNVDVGASPWAYQGNNPARLYKEANGTASDCPNVGVGNLPVGQVRQADTVPHLFSNPPQSAAAYTFSGSNADLQVSAHLVFNGHGLTGDQVFTFHATLKDAQGQTVCSSNLTVTGKQKVLGGD
jgi:hypothetical protein